MKLACSGCISRALQEQQHIQVQSLEVLVTRSFPSSQSLTEEERLYQASEVWGQQKIESWRPPAVKSSIAVEAAVEYLNFYPIFVSCLF